MSVLLQLGEIGISANQMKDREKEGEKERERERGRKRESRKRTGHRLKISHNESRVGKDFLPPFLHIHRVKRTEGNKEKEGRCRITSGKKEWKRGRRGSRGR